jgi:hypothetical protein
VPALSSSLSSLAVAVQDGELPSDGLSLRESVQLLAALATVPDPRKRRGIRHSVQSVLLLAIGAVMAGKASLVAIAGWAAHADHKLVPIGPRPPDHPPGRASAARRHNLRESAAYPQVTASEARSREETL